MSEEQIITTWMYISRRTWVESGEDWNLYNKRMTKLLIPYLEKFSENMQLFISLVMINGIRQKYLDEIFKNESHWNYE